MGENSPVKLLPLTGTTYDDILTTTVYVHKAAFLAQLRHPDVAPANHILLSLLSMCFGAEMVLDELGCLEHGVVA
jgi:hypothetical protein